MIERQNYIEQFHDVAIGKCNFDIASSSCLSRPPGELRRQHVLDGGGARAVLPDVRRRPLGQGGRGSQG